MVVVVCWNGMESVSVWIGQRFHKFLEGSRSSVEKRTARWQCHGSAARAKRMKSEERQERALMH